MEANVIIYGAGWCGFCHQARHYLDDQGVAYEYRNVEENREYGEEAVNKSGQFGIPVIDINGRIIVGFDRPTIDEMLKQAKLTT